MNRLQYWKLRYELLKDMSKLINWQSQIIQVRNNEIESLHELRLKDQLEAQRSYLDLIVAVRRAMDEPGLEESLEGMMTDVADFVARLEEQVV